MFLQLTYFPKSSLRYIMYITHTTSTTCFGTKVSSSGRYYNIGVRANLLIYVLFMVISLIKTLFTKSILHISYILCILTIHVLIKLIIMNKI